MFGKFELLKLKLLSRHVSYFSRTKKFKISLSNLEECFEEITERDLSKFEHMTHDGDILHLPKGNYLSPLIKCTETRRYSIVGHGRIISTNQIISVEKGVVDIREETGIYKPFFGGKIEFESIDVPKGHFDDLSKERWLATGIFDSFKKIRWALDRQILGDKSKCLVDLGYSYQYHIQEMSKYMQELSDFHKSGKAKPFLMGSPKKPSQGLSNCCRNMLYDDVNYWFDPKNFKEALHK